MKRSDMLGIIKSCIKHNHFGEANQYSRDEISLGRFAEICAETILDRIQAEGMTPPRIKVLTPRGSITYFNTNEWEEDANYDEHGYEFGEGPDGFNAKQARIAK